MNIQIVEFGILINGVLRAINDLIVDDSWKLLSSKDVFVLIMSGFLHDLEMHIQPLIYILSFPSLALINSHSFSSGADTK